MKIIANPITNIPKLEKSHVLGWSQVWADQLKATIDHRCTRIESKDTVYIEHGVNFGGTLNLFGGATDSLFWNVSSVMTAKEIISLDIDMPDWGAQLKKRIGAATTSKMITETWCDRVSQECKKIKTLRQEDLKDMTGISVGDSHTTSFSRSNDIVLRENGRTLFGALKRGIETDLNGLYAHGNPITFCYGSIDIRHHLLRHEDNLKNLIKEYVKQGQKIGDLHDSEISFAAPVPVEYEERRLPKTGYFKGTPFYGSQQERKDLTSRFIDELRSHNVEVVMPPERWYTMDPEKYANTHMENGSSVHIAPPYYRRNDWGESPLGA